MGPVVADDAVPSSSFTTDDPGNGVGTTDVPVNYNICPRSGFRLSNHRPLVEDGYGDMIRRESVDPRQPQDNVQAAGQSAQIGPQNSEHDNVFYPGTNADTIIESSILSQHKIFQSANIAGNAWGSAFLNFAGVDFAGITLQDNLNNFYSYVIDMSDGSFSHSSNTGTLTTLGAAVTQFRDDYYRIAIGATFTGATSVKLTINLLDDNHSTVGNKNNYTYLGSGRSLVAWGTQISTTNIDYTTGSGNLLSNAEALELWNASGANVSGNSALIPITNDELSLVLPGDL